MNQAEIVLGERSYTITELPLRRATAWRQRLSAMFGGAAKLVSDLPNTKIDDMQDVVGLVSVLKGMLVDSVDQAAELLLDFSQELRDDEEYILENAYPSQVLDGFWEAMKLAFPFGQLVGRAASVVTMMDQLGQQGRTISKNSQGQNGESGRKNSTALRKGK